LDKLRELNLYDDFIDACGDIYIQIFEEWADDLSGGFIWKKYFVNIT
jgi:hypothetical protein